MSHHSLERFNQVYQALIASGENSIEVDYLFDDGEKLAFTASDCTVEESEGKSIVTKAG